MGCRHHGVRNGLSPIRRSERILTVTCTTTGHTAGHEAPTCRGTRSAEKMPTELTSKSAHAARSKASKVVSKASARLAERDHEMRAALFAIEVAAAGLSRNRDRMTTRQVDELMDGLVAETRRVRALL